MASAGVIAVSPVAPPMPTVQDVQERVAHAAVQLTAASNPLLVWGQAIANTFGSLETLTGDATNANLNLLRELSTGYIFREAANVLILNTLNPGPLLDQVLNFNSNFGPVITSALEGTFEGLRLAAEQFPGVITESLNHLSKGEFFEAFSKVNGWFVLRVLGGVRPLIDVFSIPADFVGALPGAEKLPALLDVISEFAVTKAIFEPIIGSIVQSTEIFDATREALAAGNITDAITNLVNLPVLALNALVNGFTPATSPSEWQGLLDRGLFTYLAVTLPNQIANAIAPPAPSSLSALGGPGEFRFGGDLVPVSLADKGEGEDEGAGEGEGEGSAAGEGVGEGAAEGTGEDVTAGAGEESGEGAGEESGEGAGEDVNAGTGEESGEGAGEDVNAGAGEESGAGTGEESGETSGEESGEGTGATPSEGTGTGGSTNTGSNTSGISTSRGEGTGTGTTGSTGSTGGSGTTGSNGSTGSGTTGSTGSTGGSGTGSSTGSNTSTGTTGSTGSTSGADSSSTGSASGSTGSGSGSSGSGSGSSN
ncbi:hypothetical protein AU184_19520 [Mycolicibacterium novocastrense]|nr:hypothetical protein AU183_00905 [Mycolicibacterium novocastrense]KUH69245.1 hypothetical protein AU072_14305 [Mycolicibacterium novocastrense]KUH71298.1 hypothetical protein AU184_19520 [Mycolicibacterium novocastrense]